VRRNAHGGDVPKQKESLAKIGGWERKRSCGEKPGIIVKRHPPPKCWKPPKQKKERGRFLGHDRKSKSRTTLNDWRLDFKKKRTIKEQ